MKKKILLVNPLRAGRGQSSVQYMSTTPLALPLLAALTPPEFDVEIVDENNAAINYDAHYDLIGITVMIHVAPRAFEIAKRFKERGTPVVMGGFFPSLWPEKAEPYVDSIVVGEGERCWGLILDDLRNGRPLKKIYEQKTYVNLTEVPQIPKRFMPDDHCYHVETTRGCPYACDFCSVTRFYGNTYRHRPVDEVVKQVSQLTDKLIFFVDDNIAGDKEYAKELFRALAPLKISWSGQFTLATARDGELLDLARASGCRFLFTGFETLNDKNLKAVNKSWARPQDYPGLIKLVHDAGIAIYGSFMFGFDFDEKSVFEQTLAFTEDNKIELALFSALFPIEGSKLFDKLTAEGRIFEKDMTKYNGQHATYRPANMTAQELDDGLRWIWRTFYSKKSINKRLSHLLRSDTNVMQFAPGNLYTVEQLMVFLNTAFRVAVEDF
ncbi:MAG TPA: radical SAM protein [bacterium]|nr:radical SAM protein [bacterium]